MIYWLWYAFPDWHEDFVHIIDLSEWWQTDDEFIDVAWLGECAWTGKGDIMKVGLKSL